MKNNKTLRGFFVFALMLIMAMTLAMTLSSGNNSAEEVTYDDFIQKVRSNQVAQIHVVESKLFGLYAPGMSNVDVQSFPDRYDFYVSITEYVDLQGDLRAIASELPENAGKSPDKLTSADLNIKITYGSEQQESTWFTALLPYLIVIGLVALMFFLFMRQVQGTNNKAINFGKSKARLVDPTKQKVTFENVAGADEEKDELKEIVEFLKDPKKFVKMGARIPKGVLLVGPPGTGKTLLARAVAGEAGVPFLTISGSDFVEMYVGVGASRVRDLFEQAKRSAPSIIFIDEIDAVGRHRGSGLGGGHDEREQTLNQLLVEMDGFSVNEGIIIIAATNRPDILDPALLRPGRFDRQITVNYPDVKGREEILLVHAKGKPLGQDVDLKSIARLTPFTTGADLENILNESAILAARANKEKITMKEVLEAIDRVQMGPEKKSKKVTEHDKKLVAYHETGHALVAHHLDNCDPVHVVSIIPRGMAGGYTQTLPDEDSSYISKAKLKDRIAMSLGGYVAERLIFGDISTGSSSDLKHATETARRMITEFGMSEDVGPVYLAGEREIMIGRDMGHTRNYSEKLSAQIDNEISRIIDTARQCAETILKENMDQMHVIVDVLYEREKIDGEQFRTILAGGTLEPLFVEEDSEPTETTSEGELNPQEVILENEPTESEHME